MPETGTFSDLHHVELLGLVVMEPSTVLSSLAMTAVCVVGCRRSAQFRRQRIALLTTGFLFFMALATAIGGIIGHGFLYKTGMLGKLPGWLCGIIALAFYERGVIYRLEGLVPGRQLSRLLGLNVTGLVFFVVLTLYYQVFRISQFHAIYSLLFLIGSMEIYIYRKTRDHGSLYVFFAIGCAVMAALVHLSGFSFGVWCQANDLSHIPMAASIWFLYLAMARNGFEKAV